MKPSPQTLVLLSIVVLAALGLGMYAMQGEAGSQSSSMPPASTQKAARAPARFETGLAGRTTCRWKKGEAVAYEAEIGIRGFVDIAPLLDQMTDQAPGASPPQTKQPVNITFDWRLEVRALGDTKHGESMLAGQFVRYAPGAAAGQGLDTEAVSQVKDLPFLFKMNERCGIVDIARRDSTTPVASFLQQTSLKDLDWVYPEAGATQARYLQNEEDAQGTYKVEYTVGNQGQVQQVHRHIAHVLSVREDTSGTDPSQKDDSRVTVTGPGSTILPEKGPWFRSIQSDETRTVYVTATAPLAVLRQSKKVRQTPAGAAPALQSDLDPEGSTWIWGWTLDRPPAQAVMRPGVDIARLRAMTPEQALAEYVGLIGDESQNVSSWTGFLTQWIILHPKELPLLLAAIKSGQIPAKFGHSGVFMALGDAGTPAAQKIVMSVIEDGKNWSPSHRIMAASSVFDKDTLPAGYMDAIERMTKEGNATARSSAKLLVGAVAKQQQQKNPEAAARAKQWLTDEVGRARNTKEFSEAFGAISNTADPDFLPAITSQVTHKDQARRQVAADAMRLMPPEATKDVYASHLGRESTPKVRQALSESMASQIKEHESVPDEVVAAAIVQFGVEQDLQSFAALARVLGMAAKLGNTQAKRTLDSRLELELVKSPRNTPFLKMLGPYVSAL